MITFRDLLQDSSIWSDTFLLLQLKYEESAENMSDVPSVDEIAAKYTKLIMKLLAYPYCLNDYNIQLSLIPVDKYNKFEYVDVSLYDPIKKINDDLSSIPWREIVDLDLAVDDALATYGDEDLLAELLWELTTWGVDTEVSRTSKDLYSTFLSGFLKGDLDKN